MRRSADRGAGGSHHFAQRFLGRRRRRSDREDAGWRGLADRSTELWDRLADRVAIRRERIADGLARGWYRFSDPFVARRERVADGLALHWDRFADRVALRRERIVEGLVERWYRLRDLGPHRWGNVAHGLSTWHGPPRQRAILSTIFVCAVLALPAVALITAVTDSDRGSSRSTTDPRAAPVQGIDEPRRQGLSAGDRFPGVNVHVNEGAGYLFSYPDSWEIATVHDTTRLVGLDGDVAMTFAAAPSGSLDVASDRVVGDVTSVYSDVELVASERNQTPQGLRSLVTGGEAVDASGASVRFLIITIEGHGRNRAITIRFAPEANPLDALTAIQEIVASYRISDTN